MPLFNYFVVKEERKKNVVNHMKEKKKVRKSLIIFNPSPSLKVIKKRIVNSCVARTSGVSVCVCEQVQSSPSTITNKTYYYLVFTCHDLCGGGILFEFPFVSRRFFLVYVYVLVSR